MAWLQFLDTGGGLSQVHIIWGALATLAILSIVRTAINNFVRSPLRHIPGPWHAKLSQAWLLVVECAGQRPFYVHALHQRYGPVVRVGPREVSFASADATRDIYIGVTVAADAATPDPHQHKPPPERKRGGATVTKTFPKAPVFEITRKTVGFMTDEAEHRERLRRVGPCFAPAGLMPAVEPVMRDELATLLAALENQRGKAVDMVHWFRMLALDTVGRLFAGKSFNALTSPTPPKFAHYMDTAIHAWILKASMPRTFALLQRLPLKPKPMQDFLDSGDGVYELGEQALSEYLARHGRTPASGLPLARLVAGSPERGLSPLPDDQIANEVMSILFAGTDTTATTLTYLFFELARHPEWYARLRAEVASAAAPAASADAADAKSDAEKPSGATNGAKEGLVEQQPQQQQQQQQRLADLTYAQLKALPVLNAVMWETLRVYPAVLAGLRRQVPRGGAPVAGTGGVWLPAGTVVSTATYTLQRTAAVFPQPDMWAPARWLASASAPSTPLFPAASSSPSSSAAPKAPTCPPLDVHGGTSKGGGQASEVAHAANEARGDEKPWSIYEDDAMRSHMHAFSRGIRACLGKTVALAQLKMATAALAQHFAAVRLADERGTVADMRMTEAFVLVPKGKKCMLVFFF